MDSRSVTISRTAATTASLPGAGGAGGGGGGGGSGVRLQVPEQIGSVKLVRPLGEGGMGVVWLGRHGLLERDVAVKFLLDVPQSENDPTFAAFLQGARAAATLRHPGLNEVHHADVASGVPYLVMEYIDGPSLGDIVKQQGPIGPSAARAVIRDVCAAVAELHDHEVIHRDIKPANIMLTSDGRVVVTDFGLACPRPAAAFGASTGTLTGSPAYMAPEMFDGIVSARTDVYAIGITAYHLLAGRFPFDGTVAELRESHRHHPLDIAPLHEHGVHPLVVEAIERATNKNVLFRPRSARQVMDLFEEAFKAAGVQPAPAKALAALARSGTGGSAAAADERPANTPAITPASPAPTPAAQTPRYYDALSTLAASKRRATDDPSGTPQVQPAPLQTPPPRPASHQTPAPGTPPPPRSTEAPPPPKRSWWRRLLEGD